MEKRKYSNYWPIVIFSCLVGFLTLLYLAPLIGLGSFLNSGLTTRAVYFLIFILSVGAYLHIFLFSGKISPRVVLEKTLLLFAPTELLILYGLQKLTRLHPNFGLLSAFYILLLFIWIIRTTSADPDGQIKVQLARFFQNIKSSIAKADWKIAILVLLLMGLNLSFGLYHLGKMAVVDEPLSTFDRIPDFWKNISQRDWYNARVSDKPGLPVAAISGIGLLTEEDPKRFKKISWEGEIINPNASQIPGFNFAFRFPLLVFVVLMLPLFYWLARILAGSSAALIFVIFVGLSPILIGNSRIINPDGLLWIFTSFSFMAYLIHLKQADGQGRFYLYLSSFFLALAILTKYTANIFYLFFFALIFIEYLFNRAKHSALTVREYLKKSLIDYGILVILSLCAFYFLYPAVWEKPSRVLIGTIGSQALEPIWPFFAGALGLVLADLLLLKSRLISFALQNFLKIRITLIAAIAALFLFSAAAVFLNVYSGMKFFPFEDILASPKSSFESQGAVGMFFANFYPLLFGISPLALIFLFVFLANGLAKKGFESENFRTIAYILLFILIYYAGSVVSEVASIIRYQIILFPLILLASGIALAEIFEAVFEKRKFQLEIYSLRYQLFAVFLIFLLCIPLFSVKPFYMGYASSLLPKQFYLDVKDMGDGSYEAAQYLNSLPNSKNLKIWSDKQGVCVFFVGRCFTSLSASFFENNQLDYFVVSSGRESRTTKMTSRFADTLDFAKIYAKKPASIIEIAHRPNNFVKIIKAPDVSK